MSIIIASLLLTLMCFAGVLFFGAPYLPTLTPQVNAALKLAKLKPGDTLLELGCGDGKVLLAGAKQGIYVVGYELNPLLALCSWIRTRRYRKYVQVIWGDFWLKDWSRADAIFVFLLPKYMEKLDKKCIQYKNKPVNLVSFAFTIPGKTPDSESEGVYMYWYEA